MESPSPQNRNKIFAGVALICAAVLLMLFGEEIESRAFRAFWIVLLGLGIFFYLWGRFFSRNEP